MPPGTSFALPSTYSIRSLQLISGLSEDFSYHDVNPVITLIQTPLSSFHLLHLLLIIRL